MKTKFKLYLLSALAIGAVAAWTINAHAIGGGHAGGGHVGGGARPSLGNVGGGGGRAAGGGAQRAMPHPQPSHANISRPSMGNVARPSPAAHPSVGNFSPSGGRPNISRPTSNPGAGAGAHSNIHLPSNLPAINRPTLPSGGNGIVNHPNLGNRPIAGEHPSFGNINRPTTLPASINRPGAGGAGERLPGIDRPGDHVRPGAGGAGERLPGIDRPGDHVRPGAGGAGERFPGGDHRPDHPFIGGGGNHPDRPNRPIIGGGNRDAFINNGNINIGNRVNIGGGNFSGNRPNWDHGHWNNPAWGWGGAGGWAGNWHNHCINGHYGWYNGCWNHGYWGSNWYRPVAWAAAGWGLGALTSGWGYGTSYYNPYYVAPVAAATVPYDYSQQVAVNNYASADDSGDDSDPNYGATAPPAIADTPASDQARKLFDSGLALFKSGDYRGALADFNTALVQLPGDPVVHEVRALTLYALGDYNSAAAALNSLLSSAPGMDWTTMSGLYGNADDYTAQYHRLEQYCQANPNDPASHFVLAYHDLVIGSKDAAVAALKVVVDNQPKDTTARRMLDALSAPPQTAPPAPPGAPAEAALPNAIAAADDNGPQTDLVGTWQAKAGTSTIDLSISDDSQFTWKAVDAGKPPIELKGQLDSNGDSIELQTADKGSMAGSVKSLGPDQWQFALSGAPPTDPGLSFARVKN